MTLRKLKRIFAIIALSLAVTFCATGSSLTVDTQLPPPDAVTQTAPAESPDEATSVFLQYGPAGGIISLVTGGIIMIIRAVNDGRSINVQHYKDRAELANNEAAGDMKKLRDQMNSMELKLDEVLADRDELRETLENRKAQFSKDLLAMEKRHQEQLLETHAVMLQQLNIRQRLERLLTEHGIEIPNMSPPPSKEPPTPA